MVILRNAHHWPQDKHPHIHSFTHTHTHSDLHCITVIAWYFHLASFWNDNPLQATLAVNSSVLPGCDSSGNTDIKQCYVQYRSLGAIIAPLVSLGWFPAPSLWPLLWCFPWARLFARIEPPSLLGSPETSRSSTLEFSSQNLKNKQDVAEQSLMLHFFLFNLSYF